MRRHTRRCRRTWDEVAPLSLLPTAPLTSPSKQPPPLPAPEYFEPTRFKDHLIHLTRVIDGIMSGSPSLSPEHKALFLGKALPAIVRALTRHRYLCTAPPPTTFVLFALFSVSVSCVVICWGDAYALLFRFKDEDDQFLQANDFFTIVLDLVVALMPTDNIPLLETLNRIFDEHRAFYYHSLDKEASLSSFPCLLACSPGICFAGCRVPSSSLLTSCTHNNNGRTCCTCACSLRRTSQLLKTTMSHRLYARTRISSEQTERR